mmetsp:Transcript_19015/g.52099  ORF Transcript_19015/g.52099 Transcript_19015/m.52099 type:complete len:267 (-) Transcript_19015:268-1068(-)
MNFPPKIDLLMLNAGIMALPQRELTEDGVERQMQSNHLGHFLLTSLLAPNLSNDARIISVSSSAHQFATLSGGLEFDYLWSGGSTDSDYGFNGWKSYGQSKLANIYFSQELYRRAQERGDINWDVASLHPGVVQTDLSRYILGVENWDRLSGLFGNDGESNDSSNNWLQDGVSQTLSSLFSILTVPEGANTHVQLGANAVAERPWKAAYFEAGKKQRLSDVALDVAAARRLWQESEELAGLGENGFFVALDEKQGAATEMDRLEVS